MPLFTHSCSLLNSKLLNFNPQSVFYVYNICIPNAQNCELSAQGNLWSEIREF